MLCPTIAITFDSSTKVKPFALSHHESNEVNLLSTSYVGNNIRDHPNSDTTARMILVVRAMHYLSCVFSNTLLLGKFYVRPVLTDNVFKKIIAINIWLLKSLLYSLVPWWTHDTLFHATLRVQMDLSVGSLDGSLFLARRTANRSF